MFVHSVWYLREQGAVIEASNIVTKTGRLYRVEDVNSPMCPMWLSTKAICSLAEMAGVAGFKRK